MKISAKLIILLFTIFMYNNSKAQLDTLNYVKQFEINKANYIGKPFSKLLTDMAKIQPKTVWFVPQTNKKTKVKESLFNFCDMDFSFHNAITLYIEWQYDIPYTDVKYYHNKNNFYFTNDEKTFYGNKIVKNIMVFR